MINFLKYGGWVIVLVIAGLAAGVLGISFAYAQHLNWSVLPGAQLLSYIVHFKNYGAATFIIGCMLFVMVMFVHAAFEEDGKHVLHQSKTEKEFEVYMHEIEREFKGL